MKGGRRWILAAVGSGVAHAALLFWAMHRPLPPRPEPLPDGALEFVVVAPTPPVPEPEFEPEPEREPEPEPRRRPKVAARSPSPNTQDDLRDEPAPPEDSAGGVVVPGARAEPGGLSGAQGLVQVPDRVDLTLHASPSRGVQLNLPRAEPGPPPLRLRPRADGGYDIRDTEFSAHIAPDGTLTFEDKGAGQKFTGTGYQFDITDAVMRGLGDDPYGQQKNRVREQTAELRAKMASAACEARLKTSIVELRGRLDQIWADRGLSVERRRALLFQLWDDCAEDGPQDVLQHAEMARQTIYAFISERLPTGSEYGFRPEEIEALNRRRGSKARFEP